MGIFCLDDPLSGISTQEVTTIYTEIRSFLGAPVMGVELDDSQLNTCLKFAIEDLSSYVNNWVLQNRLGEMLGLPSDIDFTMKYISNSVYFENSFAKNIGEQVGMGANGTKQMKIDCIILSAGVQNYTIPAEREVNEVLWYTPSFINLYGLDPFNNQNIAVTEFGASFAGQSLTYVMPVFDTVLTAQAASLRNRVRGSEYSYVLQGGANGTKNLRLFPIPFPNGANINESFALTGGYGTPGTIYYFYYDRAGFYGNPEYSGNTANPGFTGLTQDQVNAGIQGNGLVSSPADAELNFISYNQLNSVAKRWVKRYALALATIVLGKGIRGKFSGELPIPGGTVTLNKDDLITTGTDEKKALIEELTGQLDSLSFDKIMERRLAAQKAVNENLSFVPMGIYRF